MLKKFLLLSTAFFLTHCAQQPLNDINNMPRYQQRLAAVGTWTMEGRILVRVPDDADRVRVIWKNHKNDYTIRLSGTLGMGATMIYGNPRQVRMEQGGEEPVIARTAEDLLYTQLGREIPISDLHYWVRGLQAPSPEPLQTHFAAEGMLEHLQQAGWDIRYNEYMAVDNWNMPKKITAVRDDVVLTLSVSKWTLSTESTL